MKISSEISSIARHVGEEKAVEYMAKAGFDAWDFSMFDMCRFDHKNHRVLVTGHPLTGDNYLAFARKLRKIGEDNGISCNQSHAPFPTFLSEVRSYYKRAIECTAEAGGKICVIHPDNNKSPEENAEIYWQFLPFAKEHGVKIATENMWNWDNVKDQSSFAACATSDSFNAHLDAVNDPFFVACLDIGHAEMRGLGTSAEQMIRTLGRHVQALHIHDTDRHHDNHQLPLTMQIDYDPILRALHDVGYQGYFTLEADSYLPGLPDDQLMQGVRSMQRAARELADRFERL